MDSLQILSLFQIVSVSAFMGFPGGSVIKNQPANAGDIGDMSLIHWSERSPGVGNGSLLWCSSLENSMDRGSWWATVHGVLKSQTWRRD